MKYLRRIILSGPALDSIPKWTMRKTKGIKLIVDHDGMAAWVEHSKPGVFPRITITCDGVVVQRRAK